MFKLQVAALSVIALQSVAGLTIDEDWPIKLLKRQAPGTPAYNCHDNCGQAIIASRSDGYCDSNVFQTDYANCLQCSGPDNQDIWKYYGGSLTTAATACGGLSTTPLSGTQPDVGPALPAAATTTTSSSAAPPPATTSSSAAPPPATTSSSAAPPPETTSSATPPPETTTSAAAPPPETTTSAAGGAAPTTSSAAVASTTTSAGSAVYVSSTTSAAGYVSPTTSAAGYVPPSTTAPAGNGTYTSAPPVATGAGNSLTASASFVGAAVIALISVMLF